MGVLTHFGTVGLQLQNLLSLPDVRRSYLKGNPEYPPWALLLPNNFLPPVTEESSGGMQRSHKFVACALNHHDIHDGLSVWPVLPTLLYYRWAEASLALWVFSHSVTPVCCSLLWSAAWINSGMSRQYSLTGKLEEGREKKKSVTKSGKSSRPSQLLWKRPWLLNNVSLVPVWGSNVSDRGEKRGGRNIAYSRNFWAWLPSKLICEQELGFYQLPSPSAQEKDVSLKERKRKERKENTEWCNRLSLQCQKMSQTCLLQCLHMCFFTTI